MMEGTCSDDCTAEAPFSKILMNRAAVTFRVEFVSYVAYVEFIVFEDTLLF